MGRNKMPVDTVTTRMSKKKRQERKDKELPIVSDAIVVPDHVHGDDRKKFLKYAEILKEMGIWSVVDADELARYVIAHTAYIDYSQRMVDALADNNIEYAAKLQLMQDKAYRQAHSSASSLGLNIASRAKIERPKKVEYADPEAPAC